MNIDKAWRITLTRTEPKALKNFKFVQYVEAESMDQAIEKARKTFNARLYAANGPGSEAQKACPHTKLNEDLCFGFKGGWTTLYIRNQTIFEALEEAQAQDFVETREITDIYSKV